MSTASHFEQKRADANEQYRGFAAQPVNGGMMDVLTGLDLGTDVNPTETQKIFQKRPLFVDNCKGCKSFKGLNGFKSEDGTSSSASSASSFWSGLNFGDIFKTGASIYSTTQQSNIADAQLKAQQQKTAQAQAATAQTAAQGSSIATIVKSYTTPIILVGVIGIAGIATYFYFKKKRIK
jgi:hypothetical protein